MIGGLENLAYAPAYLLLMTVLSLEELAASKLLQQASRCQNGACKETQ